jgi:hypothetical protein
MAVLEVIRELFMCSMERVSDYEKTNSIRIAYDSNNCRAQ